MLHEVHRTSSSWEHAAYILSKNDSTLGKNVNELSERFDTLERRFNKAKKVTAIGLLASGIAVFVQWIATENIYDRLEKCEQQLKEKEREDRVRYTQYRK